MSLSVVLATFNEQDNLERCLKSVKDIADEIIVVDGGSTDDTVKVAAKFSTRVIQTSNPPIFHINKQKALDAATGDWILQLDADEVVTKPLADEIMQIISMTDQQIKTRQIDPQKQSLFARHQAAIKARDGQFYRPGQSIAGFFLPRANQFLGRSMRYAGMYPDGVIRLVKKKFAHFPCLSVHEQIQLAGDVGWLENDLLHYDSPTFAKYLMRANRYTDLTAAAFAKQALPITFANHCRYFIAKPIILFFQLYVRHKGVLDGFPGFVFSLFSALHPTVSYMKYASSRR